MASNTVATPVTKLQKDMLDALMDSKSYPTNLVHPQEFRHELKEFYDMFIDASPRLFHASKRQYHMLDLAGPFQSYSPLSHTLTTQEEVQRILDGSTAEPLTRYLFIQSATSRGALACEQGQLTATLNYYQVMPSFLRLVVAFKAREDPCMKTSFHSDVRLDAGSPRVSVPCLKRSGFRTQHCFNLIGVETDASDQQNPWRIRQTAAYHSFDVVESQALWIVLKGNATIRTRLAADTEDYLKANPDYPKSREGCFLATLRSHLLILQWACQNWEPYSEHFTERLKRFKTVAKYTPVVNATQDERIKSKLDKSGTFNSIVSRSASAAWNSSAPTQTTGSSTLSGRLPSFFKSKSDLSNGSGKTAAKGPVLSGPDGDFDLDGDFSFEQLQSLHRLGDQIRDAIQILGENKKVFKEIMDHFHMLLCSPDFSAHVATGKHAGAISGTLQRMATFGRALDGHERRLDFLRSDVGESTVLFNEVMQYRNMRMGEFLAKQGLISTMQAEESAAKSRREAASMHAITIWTLIFLPGTFVATFFSSGILDFTGDILKFGDWSTSWIGLQLFFAISLPIMIITLAGWACFIHRARRKEAFGPSDCELGNISDKAVEEGRTLGISVS